MSHNYPITPKTKVAALLEHYPELEDVLIGVVGALERIDIRGIDGQSLKDKWADGPRTYLGMQTAGFPNFFTLVGPHNGATFCNIPRCIEQNVDWLTDAIKHMPSVEPSTNV